MLHSVSLIACKYFTGSEHCLPTEMYKKGYFKEIHLKKTESVCVVCLEPIETLEKVITIHNYVTDH